MFLKLVINLHVKVPHYVLFFVQLISAIVRNNTTQYLLSHIVPDILLYEFT